MTFYTDYIYYSGTNTPVANQAVTIKDHGTDTNSTIYDGTGAEIANPTYTDTLGKFEFYVAAGAATYDIYVNSVLYDSFSSVTVPEKLDTANPSATGTFTLNGTDLTSDFTKLHSVTASAAELNLLDGVTTTTQQLNYCNTLTSDVQNQFATKAPLDSPHFTGLTDIDSLRVGNTFSSPLTLAYSGLYLGAIDPANFDPDYLGVFKAGSWTPQLKLGATNVGGQSQDGSYLKIGNVVFFRAYINVSSVGAGTGSLTITGLPSTQIQPSGGGSSHNVAQIVFVSGVGLTTEQLHVGMTAWTSSQTLTLYKQTSYGSRSNLTHANIQSGTEITITGFWID